VIYCIRACRVLPLPRSFIGELSLVSNSEAARKTFGKVCDSVVEGIGGTGRDRLSGQVALNV
jgi:hypothetical protein